MKPQLLATLAALQLAAACSTIDTTREPPADWPELAIVEHHSNALMQQHCSSLGFGMLACAWVDFSRGICSVYYGDAPMPAFVMDHERAHCKGYDHPGESAMRNAWTTYQRAAFARQ